MLTRLRRALSPPTNPAPGPGFGGLPWDDLYGARPAAGTAVRTNRPIVSIASSAQSVMLAPANPARRSLEIFNDSTAVLSVAFGPVASALLPTQRIAPGGALVLEEPGVYQGDVAGVWASVNGSARITETV